MRDASLEEVSGEWTGDARYAEAARFWTPAER
jgi:hypothetical protein